MMKSRENIPPVSQTSPGDPPVRRKGHFAGTWQNDKTGAELTVEADTQQAARKLFRGRIRHLHEWKETQPA